MARAWLTDRKVLTLAGQDRVSFLQGLVSNDVTTATPENIVWTAFLTPQGRYLAEFFIWNEDNLLFLDTPASQAESLRARLGRFRLRSDVQIEISDCAVEALWGADHDKASRPDPRIAGFGSRRIVTGRAQQAEDPCALAAYHAHRINHGLPDAADCETEKTLLLEANFDLLNGLSLSKGCYMGQEITARSHYRGLIRKRLIQVTGNSPLPSSGTAIFDGEREVGQLRTSAGKRGLAFLRREAWTRQVQCGGLTLTPSLADWFEDKIP